MATAKLSPTQENFGSLIAAELKSVTPAKPSKCPHGVHIGANDSVAYYCQACWPDGGPPNQRLVSMPNTHAHDRAKANRRTREQCPECGSFVHEEIPSGWWRCAECGKAYKAPRRRQHHVAT